MFKNIFKYINNNVLFKVASLNSVAVGVRVLTGLITSKVIAIFVGAEGLALIGNLRNFLTSVQSVSTLGLYNGMVKYVSQYKKNTDELSKVMSTVYYLGFFTLTVICALCYFYAEGVSDYVFGDMHNYADIIKILAIALPFYALNTYAFSILNGFSKYKILLIIKIISQIFGMAVTVLLIWQERVKGALLAVVIVESITFLITVVGISYQRNLTALIKASNIKFSYFKKLGSYSVMALFSAMVLPLVFLYIRNYITERSGLESAGHWEAMNRISKYYLMFITSLLTLYILPRFAEITDKLEFRKEVLNFYKTIMPIFAIGLIVIYVLRSFIISVIFTKAFQPVSELFFWQLLGDFVKVLSVVLAYQFLAKRMFWEYILTEAFSIIVLYLASTYFIDLYGAKGATIAHFVNYVLYLTAVVFVLRKQLFG